MLKSYFAHIACFLLSIPKDWIFLKNSKTNQKQATFWMYLNILKVFGVVAAWVASVGNLYCLQFAGLLVLHMDKQCICFTQLLF